MSRRTTPSWVSTFGPFDPSPGYGPAVSSGIVPVAGDDAEVGPDVDVSDVDDAPLLAVPFDAHPATATSPAPPSSCRMRRRVGSLVIMQR